MAGRTVAALPRAVRSAAQRHRVITVPARYLRPSHNYCLLTNYTLHGSKGTPPRTRHCRSSNRQRHGFLTSQRNHRCHCTIANPKINSGSNVRCGCDGPQRCPAICLMTQYHCPVNWDHLFDGAMAQRPAPNSFPCWIFGVIFHARLLRGSRSILICYRIPFETRFTSLSLLIATASLLTIQI